MIIKQIHSQDAFYKLSPRKSGETSLNISNELLQLIAPSLTKGNNMTISFILYREDYLKAIGVIFNSLPLYISSSTSYTLVDADPDIFLKDYQSICSFFGTNESKIYTVNLYYREDGRIYLNSLEDDASKFNLRHFLIEEKSILQFEKNSGGISIRLRTDLDNLKITESEIVISTQKELFRHRAAATFLKKAMLITLEKDTNLNRLAVLNKYKKTPKQLTINGFLIGRDKSQPPTRPDDVYIDVSWEYNSVNYVLYLEWTPEKMENLFFPVYNEAYFGMFQMEKDQNGEYVLYEIYQDYQNNVDKPLQQIFYGAPGTGKSDAIKRLTADGGRFTKDFTFRTTFHPDSDYSTFVGAYKPIWSDEKEKIIYEFRPQAFLKAYVAAWTNPDKQVALVVEEINRGNCAQIFGDIFQLLDREANGLSKYPIEADIDMQKFLYDALNGKIDEDWAGTIPDNDTAEINACYSKHYNDAFDKIRDGKILTLPKNLSILATMNTSDQSLFPMDSAFKRRWDWIYQPIVEGVNKETGNRLGWKIKIDDYKPIDWWAFIDRINKVIFDLTSSEDKQLGYFFCMPEREGETTISAERFVEKVVFYLWNDVFKDYSYEPECCNKKDKKDEKVKYSDFYTIDGKDIEKGVLAYFINQLKTKDGEVDHMAKKSKDVEDAGNDSGAGMGEESGAQDNSIDALPQGSLF